MDKNRITPEASEQIITSRLLILQSKRLILNSFQRRLDETGVDALRQRVERLRLETALAQYAYRSAILAWDSPDKADYWLVAYGRLIEMGQALTSKLRDAALTLPLSDRYQVSADVEMLEEIVAHWTEAMRKSMGDAVA